MNYEKYENKIKELLANENIKYNEEELEKVVKYIVEKYDGKTILDENTISDDASSELKSIASIIVASDELNILV